MDSPSRLSKKSSAFFGSLQNASLLSASQSKKLPLCGASACCRRRFAGIRFNTGDSRPLVLPLRNGTLFLQAKVFRQAEGTVRMDGPFFHLFIPRSYTQGAFLYSGVKWLTMLA